MADSSSVDAALATLLSNDPTLAGLMPDGVYFDVAAPESKAFVIVSQLSHEDTPMLDGAVAWESFLYLVKAVALGNSGIPVKDAAARIHALLQNSLLSPSDYLDMHCQRVERVRYTEVDVVTDARWNHRGAHYEVWVQPVD